MHGDHDHFPQFEYTMLGSSRLSCTLVVLGRDVDGSRFTEMILRLLGEGAVLITPCCTLADEALPGCTGQTSDTRLAKGNYLACNK